MENYTDLDDLGDLPPHPPLLNLSLANSLLDLPTNISYLSDSYSTNSTPSQIHSSSFSNLELVNSAYRPSQSSRWVSTRLEAAKKDAESQLCSTFTQDLDTTTNHFQPRFQTSLAVERLLNTSAALSSTVRRTLIAERTAQENASKWQEYFNNLIQLALKYVSASTTSSQERVSPVLKLHSKDITSVPLEMSLRTLILLLKYSTDRDSTHPQTHPQPRRSGRKCDRLPQPVRDGLAGVGQSSLPFAKISQLLLWRKALNRASNALMFEKNCGQRFNTLLKTSASFSLAVSGHETHFRDTFSPFQRPGVTTDAPLSALAIVSTFFSNQSNHNNSMNINVNHGQPLDLEFSRSTLPADFGATEPQSTPFTADFSLVEETQYDVIAELSQFDWEAYFGAVVTPAAHLTSTTTMATEVNSGDARSLAPKGTFDFQTALSQLGHHVLLQGVLLPVHFGLCHTLLRIGTLFDECVEFLIVHGLHVLDEAVSASTSKSKSKSTISEGTGDGDGDGMKTRTTGMGTNQPTESLVNLIHTGFEAGILAKYRALVSFFHRYMVPATSFSLFILTTRLASGTFFRHFGTPQSASQPQIASFWSHFEAKEVALRDSLLNSVVNLQNKLDGLGKKLKAGRTSFALPGTKSPSILMKLAPAISSKYALKAYLNSFSVNFPSESSASEGFDVNVNAKLDLNSAFSFMFSSLYFLPMVPNSSTPTQSSQTQSQSYILHNGESPESLHGLLNVPVSPSQLPSFTVSFCTGLISLTKDLFYRDLSLLSHVNDLFQSNSISLVPHSEDWGTTIDHTVMSDPLVKEKGHALSVELPLPDLSSTVELFSKLFTKVSRHYSGASLTTRHFQSQSSSHDVEPSNGLESHTIIQHFICYQAFVAYYHHTLPLITSLIAQTAAKFLETSHHHRQRSLFNGLSISSKAWLEKEKIAIFTRKYAPQLAYPAAIYKPLFRTFFKFSLELAFMGPFREFWKTQLQSENQVHSHQHPDQVILLDPTILSKQVALPSMVAYLEETFLEAETKTQATLSSLASNSPLSTIKSPTILPKAQPKNPFLPGGGTGGNTSTSTSASIDRDTIVSKTREHGFVTVSYQNIPVDIVKEYLKAALNLCLCLHRSFPPTVQSISVTTTSLGLGFIASVIGDVFIRSCLHPLLSLLERYLERATIYAKAYFSHLALTAPVTESGHFHPQIQTEVNYVRSLMVRLSQTVTGFYSGIYVQKASLASLYCRASENVIALCDYIDRFHSPSQQVKDETATSTVPTTKPSALNRTPASREIHYGDANTDAADVDVDVDVDVDISLSHDEPMATQDLTVTMLLDRLRECEESLLYRPSQRYLEEIHLLNGPDSVLRHAYGVGSLWYVLTPPPRSSLSKVSSHSQELLSVVATILCTTSHLEPISQLRIRRPYEDTFQMANQSDRLTHQIVQQCSEAREALAARVGSVLLQEQLTVIHFPFHSKTFDSLLWNPLEGTLKTCQDLFSSCFTFPIQQILEQQVVPSAYTTALQAIMTPSAQPLNLKATDNFTQHASLAHTPSATKYLPGPSDWVMVLGEFMLHLHEDIESTTQYLETSSLAELSATKPGYSLIEDTSSPLLPNAEPYWSRLQSFLIERGWAPRFESHAEKDVSFSHIKAPLPNIPFQEYGLGNDDTQRPPSRQAILQRLQALLKLGQHFLLLSDPLSSQRRAGNFSEPRSHLHSHPALSLWNSILERLSIEVCLKMKHFLARSWPYIQSLGKSGSIADSPSHHQRNVRKDLWSIATFMLQMYADLKHFHQLVVLAYEQQGVPNHVAEEPILTLLAATKSQIVSLFPAIVIN